MARCQLTLSDGTVFEGISVGAAGAISGELVFTTSMTGYEKILTDPSYQGQVVVFTAPHIGVTGIKQKDLESKQAGPLGCVMMHCSRTSFHPDAEMSLPLFLQNRGILAIEGIDTRSLARKIKAMGSLSCHMICEGGDEKKEISFSEPCLHEKGPCIVVIDYGVKVSILQAITSMGYNTALVSPSSHIDEVMAKRPCGVVVSNGPFDPRLCDLTLLKGLIARYMPILGICLGHQLVALALGAKIEPLSVGHRSSNHPIIDVLSGKVWITAQNHGFHVIEKDLPPSLTVGYRSLIDGTIEGCISTKYPFITMQCHPEGAPGPSDMLDIFDRFHRMIQEK